MKIKLATFLCFVTLSSLFGQGALTPPGAPVPMMKTLSQIEPRMAITNSGAVTISQPGSYYLTTNITVSSGNGITINTNDVTIDLNGFTIFSTEASPTGTAILLGINNISDITILNGHIRGGVTNNGSGTFTGPGFSSGIFYAGTTPNNIRVAGISVNGCSFHAIFLSTGNSTLVEDCTVKSIGGTALGADCVSHCVVSDCGATGIFATTVSDSRGESTGSGDGIHTTTANNCFGISASGNGIYAAVANNCSGQSSTGAAIYAFDLATGCVGYCPAATSIHATMANGCYNAGGTNNILLKYNML